MQPWHYILLALLLVPSGFGAYVAFAKSEAASAYVVRSGQWVRRRYAMLVEAPALWKRHGLRWLLWPVAQLEAWTQPIADPYRQSGLRAAGYSLAMLLALCGLALLAYATVVVVLFAIMVMVALWVVGLMLGGDSDGKPQGGGVMSRLANGGSSRERTDWLGDKVTEHRDDDGRVVGRSRQKQDMFGDAYVEHVDADGMKVGESVQRKDLFGDAHAQHTGSDGQLTGQSRTRSDIWGDQVETHRDVDGRDVAESRSKKGLLGDRYTEHKPRE